MAAVFKPIKAAFAFLLYIINTVIWVIPVFLCGLIKLIPISPLQSLCSRIADSCASMWVSCNGVIQNLLHGYQLTVTGDNTLSKDEWYMVVANHQSWVDILVLQRVLNGKAPLLKFFLKQELLYVPLLGLAWWALDFPFMKRYTPKQIRKNPKLKGKDLETAKRSCEKFKNKPVSIMNFVEGTRYTAFKHEHQRSPYSNLLRPKAGGLAFALNTMGEQISYLVDVSIHYGEQIPSFWDFLSGNTGTIKVHINKIPMDNQWIGDYSKNTDFKHKFQNNLAQLWLEKDKQLEYMSQE